MEVVDKKKTENAVTNEQKLQYENDQLKRMLNNMHQQMEQINLVNVFKRLEFLFKVVEYKATFPEAFVKECVEEIQGRITIPTEEPKEENKEEA